ncbi:LCP family protein [Halalkalibacter hemicellulosilyticus]|uniref:Regulatory protein MsrR n=1 Tax=Halalkalibacter hemicellulosilyticusJCM 9152 TaxID=1236971 RepID=W4QID0_9BACI|nr:LCP family protein [Halalkalibacter hemicellulosilyticus]GAE31851.1 cell envelope-associated transcriptional attenuator LytR-CpsA-Psr [Halalkalibacter hemicellulosilyticusJCM 9152]
MKRRDVRKTKKRKRWFVRTFIVMILIFLSVASYVYIEYYRSMKASEAELGLTEEREPEEFNGAVPNDLGKVNILLLGIDDTEEGEPARTDAIMVAQFDPSENTAKLVSIMRDTYVEIPGYRNYKVNTAYFLGGAELLRETLDHNFGIDLHYYALVDFGGFEAAVNALAPSGVEIDVERDMSEKIGVELEQGLQQLDGKELLGYARFRADAEGDFGRVRRQQQVLSALKEEVFSVTGITNLPSVVGTVQPYIQTNLRNREILGLLSDVILNQPDEIETLRVPLDDTYVNNYYSHAGAVLEPDFEQNRRAIAKFLGKEVPSTIDPTVGAQQQEQGYQ